jgi:mannose-6-phosphate isomerase
LLYPFTFHPRFKERIWGGRRLAELYNKALPPDALIGESWEVSDRPGDESVIANGPFAGRSIRWLMEQHGAALLGDAAAAAGDRFPLLCKILDARDRLSLQVHPPAAKAEALGGEPKTEMWYIADADPGAELYVGLRRGMTRAEFESRIQTGDVAGCFHRIAVRAGDTMFLPSGRVHAIGAGLVIFEIQQNSDTTYRVFDWHRVGLDGLPRELHVEESMASIDFDDFEPGLVDTSWEERQGARARSLARHALFRVDLLSAETGGTLPLSAGRYRVLAVTGGGVTVEGGGQALPLREGEFALVPASVADAVVQMEPAATLLMVEPGA